MAFLVFSTDCFGTIGTDTLDNKRQENKTGSLCKMGRGKNLFRYGYF